VTCSVVQMGDAAMSSAVVSPGPTLHAQLAESSLDGTEDCLADCRGVSLL